MLLIRHFSRQGGYIQEISFDLDLLLASPPINHFVLCFFGFLFISGEGGHDVEPLAGCSAIEFLGGRLRQISDEIKAIAEAAGLTVGVVAMLSL